MEWNNVKWIAFGDSLTDDTGECGTKAPNKYHKLIKEATGASVTVLGKGNTGYYTLADQYLAFYQRMSAAVTDPSVNIVTVFGSVNDHAIYNGWTTIAGIQMPDYKLSAGKIASSGLNLSFGDLGNENAPSDSDIATGVAKLALTDTISGGDTTFVAYVNECINLAHSKFPNAKIVLVNEIAGLDLRAGQIKKNIAIKEAIVKKRRAAGDTWLSLFRLNSCRFDGIADSARQYVNAVSGSGLSFDNGQIENADFRAYYTYDNRLHPNDLYNRLWLAPMFANILAESLGITSIPSSLSVGGYNISSLWLDGTPDAPSGDIPSAPEEPVYPSVGGYLYRIDGTAIPLGVGNSCDCDPNAGGVVSGSISGDTITLENKDGTTVSIPGIPQAGGVVSGSVSDNSLTLENKDGTTAVIQLPQSGGDFSEVERKLKFLYELTRGQAWDYETDSAEAYSKAIPSGARMASVNAIGGRSFKWNQMFDKSRVTFRTSTPSTVEVSNSGNVYKGTILDKTSCLFQSYQSVGVEANHVYWCCCKIKATSAVTKLVLRFGYSGLFSASTVEYSTGAWVTVCDIRHAVSAPASQGFFVYCDVNQQTVAGDTIEFDADSVVYSDLTATFGAGNEPTTVDAAIAAYRALGIDITQPQPYDAGSIKHTAVTEVVTRGMNLLNDFKNYPFDSTSRNPNTNLPFTPYTVIPRYSATGYGAGMLPGNEITVSENGFKVAGLGSSYGPAIVVPVKPSTTYTFGGTDASTTVRIFAVMISGEHAYQSYKTISYTPTSFASSTITTSHDTAYMVIGASSSVTNEEYTVADLFLYEGDIASPVYKHGRAPITQSIPASVLALDGYGWSAGTAKNYIYRDGNKWWYRQEVVAADFDKTTRWTWSSTSAGDMYWTYVDYFIDANLVARNKGKIWSNILSEWGASSIHYAGATDNIARVYVSAGYTHSDGEQPHGMLYYELAEPILTDITEYMTNLDPYPMLDMNYNLGVGTKNALDPFEVEAGGSITFESSSKAEVPNEVEYLIKLSEVVTA